MEFVDGENLASLLHRIGRLPADKVTEIARKLCAGSAAALAGLVAIAFIAPCRQITERVHLSTSPDVLEHDARFIGEPAIPRRRWIARPGLNTTSRIAIIFGSTRPG